MHTWRCDFCRLSIPGTAYKPHCKPGTSEQCNGLNAALRSLRKTLAQETPLTADEFAEIMRQFANREDLGRRTIGRLLATARRFFE